MLMHRREAENALEFAEKVWDVWKAEPLDLKTVYETLSSFRNKLAMTPADCFAADNRYADLLTAAVKARCESAKDISEPKDEEIKPWRFEDPKYDPIKKMLDEAVVGGEKADEIVRRRRTAFEICVAILKFTAAQQLYRYADPDTYQWGEPEVAPGESDAVQPADEKKKNEKQKKVVNAEDLQRRISNAMKEKAGWLFTFDVYDNQISGVYKYARTFNSTRAEILCPEQVENAVVKVPVSLIDTLIELGDNDNRLSATEIGGMVALIMLIYGINERYIPSPLLGWTDAFPLPFGGKSAVGLYLRSTNAAGAVNSIYNAYKRCGGKDVVLEESKLGVTSVALSQRLVEELRKQEGYIEIKENNPRAVADAVREYVKKSVPELEDPADKEILRAIQAMKEWKQTLPEQLTLEILKVLLAQQLEAVKGKPKKKLPSNEFFRENSKDWLLQMVCAQNMESSKAEKMEDWTPINAEAQQGALKALYENWETCRAALHPAVFNRNSRIGVCWENDSVIYSIDKQTPPELTMLDKLKSWSEEDLWTSGDKAAKTELAEAYAKQVESLEEKEMVPKSVKYPFANSGDSARTWLVQMICVLEWKKAKEPKGWHVLPENSFANNIGKLQTADERNKLKDTFFVGKKWKIGLKAEKNNGTSRVMYCISPNKA